MTFQTYSKISYHKHHWATFNPPYPLSTEGRGFHPAPPSGHRSISRAAIIGRPPKRARFFTFLDGQSMGNGHSVRTLPRHIMGSPQKTNGTGMGQYQKGQGSNLEMFFSLYHSSTVIEQVKFAKQRGLSTTLFIVISKLEIICQTGDSWVNIRILTKN